MLHRPLHNVGAHEVHIWHLLADHVADERTLKAAEALLTMDEQVRMNCFHRGRDRVLYLLSRGLMRSVLASYLDCPGREVRFASDAHGKPILQAGSHAKRLHFNLTHSRGAIALAVSGGREVGIDVEERHREVDYLALAERFFAAEEFQYLQTLDRTQLPHSFFAIWTLKEAFVKGIGRGISFPLDAFCFDLDANRLLKFRPLADFVSPAWHFQQFDLGERHCGAVAVQQVDGAEVIITMRDWREAFVKS
jgi:4'-phosphopantetheinyl transferase